MLGVDGAGENHDCCVDEDERRGQGVMVLAKGQMEMQRDMQEANEGMIGIEYGEVLGNEV